MLSPRMFRRCCCPVSIQLAGSAIDLAFGGLTAEFSVVLASPGPCGAIAPSHQERCLSTSAFVVTNAPVFLIGNTSMRVITLAKLRCP